MSLQLDATRRSVILGGRPVALQEKSWQVLSMLISRAPEVVRRGDIIREVWQDNFLTGDKGLNQAVWAIRVALDEDPREPAYIRTVPRVGYQWLHADPADDPHAAKPAVRPVATRLAGLLAVCVVIVASTDSPDLFATEAYLVDRDVHVEFASGCLLVLKNSGKAKIGAPVLSSDGSEVAVTLHEPDGCRLVTFNVNSRERREFGGCPAG